MEDPEYKDYAIKMERTDIGCERVSWIHRAQVGDQVWSLVTVGSKFVFPYKKENVVAR
jgi:hypothetical protein